MRGKIEREQILLRMNLKDQPKKNLAFNKAAAMKYIHFDQIW